MCFVSSVHSSPTEQLGCPPRIPAGATLLYDVRLEIAVDSTAADETETWSWERTNASTFEERLLAARAYHRKVLLHRWAIV